MKEKFTYMLEVRCSHLFSILFVRSRTHLWATMIFTMILKWHTSIMPVLLTVCNGKFVEFPRALSFFESTVLLIWTVPYLTSTQLVWFAPVEYELLSNILYNFFGHFAFTFLLLGSFFLLEQFDPFKPLANLGYCGCILNQPTTPIFNR